jgi:hypothetical protein
MVKSGARSIGSQIGGQIVRGGLAQCLEDLADASADLLIAPNTRPRTKPSAAAIKSRGFVFLGLRVAGGSLTATPALSYSRSVFAPGLSAPGKGLPSVAGS